MSAVMEIIPPAQEVLVNPQVTFIRNAEQEGAKGFHWVQFSHVRIMYLPREPTCTWPWTRFATLSLNIMFCIIDITALNVDAEILKDMIII